MTIQRVSSLSLDRIRDFISDQWVFHPYGSPPYWNRTQKQLNTIQRISRRRVVSLEKISFWRQVEQLLKLIEIGRMNRVNFERKLVMMVCCRHSLLDRKPFTNSLEWTNLIRELINMSVLRISNAEPETIPWSRYASTSDQWSKPNTINWSMRQTDKHSIDAVVSPNEKKSSAEERMFNIDSSRIVLPLTS